MFYFLINLVLVISTVVINFIANYLPIAGVTTGEVSDSFMVYFVPAGYVFSIWGLIYLLLFVFVGYQGVKRGNFESLFKRITPYFVVGSLANIFWIFAWHYQQFDISLLLMVMLLVSLVFIYFQILKYKKDFLLAEKLAIQLPFSVYLGWISVATIANVTIYLSYLGVEGGAIGGAGWAAVMIVVAAVLASILGLMFMDTAYVLVIMWAVLGIAIKFSNESVIVLVSGLTLLTLLLVVFKNWFLKNGKSS